MTLWKKPFENIVGKGENAGNQHFLLFPQCFLLYYFYIIGHFVDLSTIQVSRNQNVERFVQVVRTFISVDVKYMCLTLYHIIPAFNDPENEAF